MQVLTKDNLSVEADAALYYRVNDAAQATFAVDNFLTALANLGMVTLLGAGRRLEPLPPCRTKWRTHDLRPEIGRQMFRTTTFLYPVRKTVHWEKKHQLNSANVLRIFCVMLTEFIRCR